MKNVRYLSGEANVNGEAIVPCGQLLHVRVIPACDAEVPVGCWVQIANSKPFYCIEPLILRAEDFGNDIRQPEADMYPGDVQIIIRFGTNVAPPGTRDEGQPPRDWLVIYNGGMP